MAHLRTDCSSPAKLSRDPFWTLHPRGWIICKLWYPTLTLVSYHCGLHCCQITIIRSRDVEMLFCRQLLSRPKENRNPLIVKEFFPRFRRPSEFFLPVFTQLWTRRSSKYATPDDWVIVWEKRPAAEGAEPSPSTNHHRLRFSPPA